MKLIIAGASGYVAEELLRQSLKRPDITSVVALSRKAVSAPSDVGGDSNVAKLRSVIIEDYETYPDDVRREFQGANACIWYSPGSYYLTTAQGRVVLSCACTDADATQDNSNHADQIRIRGLQGRRPCVSDQYPRGTQGHV